MDIQALKHFYEVAAIKSISKVANLSHISQSALSQQLLKLENELGVPLLERSNKGVNLTKEGKLILKHIDTITNAYDRMIEDVSSIKRDNKDSSFTISSPSSSVNSIILKAIINLKDKYRNYHFKLNTMAYNNIELELDNNLSDIVLTYDTIDRDNIASLMIGSDELIFVANPEIEFDKSISVKDILQYSFILLGDGPDIKRLLHLALLEKGHTIDDLNIVFVANSIDIAKSSVYQAKAISILPSISVQDDINNGRLKTFKVQNIKIRYEIFFSYRYENYKKLKKIIDDFKKQIKGLLK